MKAGFIRTRSGFRHAAFTLIEVALALGIVGFALVAIVGALPLAMNTGRLSIAQNRAATVATTLFANIRSWPFNNVQCLDPASGHTTSIYTIDLDKMVTTKSMPPTSYTSTSVDPSQPLQFYAAFDEVTSTASTSDPRRLHFFGTNPATGLYYTIVLYFNNNPAGTLVPYQTASTAVYAEANAIEATISESDRPKDFFRFTTVISNRLK